MEFPEAARVLGARLAAGDDSLAAAGAVHLAVEAWKHLGGSDPAWDRFGLEVLDVRSRLYVDDVEVEAAAPNADGPEVRAAVRDLIGHLARHHDRCAVARDGLAQRLDHDAAAQQLRRAAAALA
ncbi:hypothetical protein [Micromonospora globosa]|uniref:hypothetical protein n=1 Tax=Micromonospora globosa TaxID=47863 RepID=UPI0012FC0180|nr:hypothetical protein [Micromonospora globosa]